MLAVAGGLSVVDSLIRVLKRDESQHVRFDAERALIKLCFTRPTANVANAGANWWSTWWESHRTHSRQELLSHLLASYLFATQHQDDEAKEFEITLGIALGLDWGVSEDVANIFTSAIVHAVGDNMTLTALKEADKARFVSGLAPKLNRFSEALIRLLGGGNGRRP